MLRFYKIPGPATAAKIISSRLTTELAEHKPVVWTLSGGSNIAIEVAAMRLIPVDLQKFLVIMIDERYGPYGHPDSNLQQLSTAGFDPGKANLIPVLTPVNETLEATAERYESATQAAFAKASAILAQLGIGSDGHISGILPHSAAVSATGLVCGYRSEQFARITFTFKALEKVSAAYVFAFGADKRDQIERLRDETLPLETQPAQILKRIPESNIYCDQIGQAV